MLLPDLEGIEMSCTRTIKYYAIRIAIILGLWIIMVLLISSITFISVFQENEPLGAVEILTFEFLCITPWILSTPLIIWAARKYRFEKNRLHTSLPVHFLTALFVFAFHSVIQSYEVSVYFDYVFDWSYIRGDFIRFLDWRVMLYTGVVLGVYAVDFQRKNRESKLREPLLKAKLNKVRYQALLNQIQPTFLLNTIDAVRDRSRINPNESEQMVTDFSDLLRIMLQNANRDEITVQEDLQAYHIYLKLLEKRLEAKVKKETEIDDDCYEALVPSFLILIPVFEEVLFLDKDVDKGFKSITYYATHRAGRVHIRIAIRDITVSPMKLEAHLHKARFMDILQRLENRYGEAVELQVQAFQDRIQTDLKIPFNLQATVQHYFNGQSPGETQAGRETTGRSH